MELTCPKCQGSMRTYERNGVHVDQCTECRGIFLDRGELERLVNAENSWHGSATSADPGRHEERPAGRSDLGGVVSEVLHQAKGHPRGASGQHYDQGRGGYGGGHGRRKKSFLEELFD